MSRYTKWLQEMNCTLRENPDTGVWSAYETILMADTQAPETALWQVRILRIRNGEPEKSWGASAWIHGHLLTFGYAPAFEDILRTWYDCVTEMGERVRFFNMTETWRVWRRRPNGALYLDDLEGDYMEGINGTAGEQ